MKDDHYKTLDLSRQASTSEIKLRYKSLAKRYHPDRAGNTEMMSRINNAYTVLKDPLQRFQYNRTNAKAGIEPDYSNTQQTTGNAPADTPLVKPIPQLRFQPFRSVSVVAILVLTFAILGVFGYVHDVASPGGTHLGSASSTTSSNAAKPAPVTGGIATAVQDGKNMFSSAEHDIHSGQAAIENCNNQREKDEQAVDTTKQQIRLTENQLGETSQYTRRGGFIHPASVSSQYDQLHVQLEQQLAQYRQDMAAFDATGTTCS